MEERCVFGEHIDTIPVINAIKRSDTLEFLKLITELTKKYIFAPYDLAMYCIENNYIEILKAFLKLNIPDFPNRLCHTL